MSGCEAAASPPARRLEAPPPSRLEISPRTGKLALHPCASCHDHIAPSDNHDTAGARPKHDEVRLDHFDGAEHCDGCHDGEHPGQLRLLTGETVTLDESHDLCGQCHATKRQDWNIGAHGKHVGGWAGVKVRLACTDCHDPHRPARPVVRAEPGPRFPGLGIPKGEH